MLQSFVDKIGITVVTTQIEKRMLYDCLMHSLASAVKVGAILTSPLASISANSFIKSPFCCVQA